VSLTEPDTTAAVSAVLEAHHCGQDVGEFTARVLAAAAAEVGGSEELLSNRPGSWEADLVRRLLRATVGESDEHLGDYARRPDG
jgi:hypothetical protein